MPVTGVTGLEIGDQGIFGELPDGWRNLAGRQSISDLVPVLWLYGDVWVNIRICWYSAWVI